MVSRYIDNEQVPRVRTESALEESDREVNDDEVDDNEATEEECVKGYEGVTD